MLEKKSAMNLKNHANNIAVASLVMFAMPITSIVADDDRTDKSKLAQQLLSMSLEELMEVEVISANKRPQTVRRVAAAIEVITQEDIQRAGITRLPELFYRIPGMQVTQYNAHDWAVSIRGFNGLYAKYLLVMVDGRTVYTPEFSGIFWHSLDLVLEDIERIEIVRGPGGSLWGANAVNGVINIITKHAKETQGGVAALTSGDQVSYTGTLRYGGQLVDNDSKVYVRSYAKTRKFDGFPPVGARPSDEWQSQQFGFRVDGETFRDDHWTVQGDVYDGRESSVGWFNPTFPPYEQRTKAANLLMRWSYPASAQSQFDVQMYVDYNRQVLQTGPSRNRMLDLDIQHRWQPNFRHNIVWGGGYRFASNIVISQTNLYKLIPPEQDVDFYNLFFQDEITLSPEELYFIIGSRIEYVSHFAGWNAQPNVRMLWLPTSQHTLWAAISRTVHIPSRISRNIMFTSINPNGSFRFQANPDVNETYVTAWETGWRGQLTQQFSVDIAVFYNQYERFYGHTETIEQTADGGLLVSQFGVDSIDGESYGFELSSRWQVLNNWRLQGSFSRLDISIYPEAGVAQSSIDVAYSHPRYQLAFDSYWDINRHFNANLWWRYVSDIKEKRSNTAVPAYTALDARLNWQVNEQLQVSLTGRNLLDSQHLEAIVNNGNTQLMEVPRSIYGQIEWRF